MAIIFSIIATVFLVILLQNRNIKCESQLTDIDNEEPIDISYLGNEIYGIPDENVGKRLENANLTILNAEELGSYLEGDMLMPAPLGPRGRNGMKDETYRWPNGIVPIEMHGPFNQKDKDVINGAIDAYHKNTCIKFKQREKEKDYIVIKNTQTGCWANVGRNGGPQTVNLQSPGCVYKIGTVEHEFMHALGFLHEQNREDRDGFVTINWNNIESSTHNNFKLAPTGSTNAFSVPYDYGSIMHYSAYSFATNKNTPTIVAKNTKNGDKMGQRNGFSPSDIKKIWKMYKCSKTTSSGGTKPSSFNAIEAVENFVSNFLGIGDEEELGEN